MHTFKLILAGFFFMVHIASEVTNQLEQTVLQGINVTANEQDQSVFFPAASAFFQFPAKAVVNPISISCIKHQNCKVKPRSGDVFCSSIVKIEPEGYRFEKPVTVLLSHCAAQDGAYADYYELTIQKLGKQDWEDLETEQLGKPEDLPEKTVSDFCDIFEYIPFAQASITEASILVATTRIRSEEIILVPDEMYVYPKSYGNETDLVIIFPVGAVEEECHITVQVFPVRDMLNVSRSQNDQLIQFPVLKVSGRSKPFLESVKVVFGHSCAAIEDLDEEFFPVDKKFLFTSKYGVMLRNHTDLEGNKTWENIQGDETAVIERSRKDRLEISFCIDHFCKLCIAAKKREGDSTEGVGHSCASDQPDVKAVCVAPYETDSQSERKLFAVVAPFNKKKKVETDWGRLQGETLFLNNNVQIFYCVPLVRSGHLQLEDDNIRFDQDEISIGYNRVKRDEPVLDGLDMRFLPRKCVDNKHFGTDRLGKCPITPKKVTHLGKTLITAVDKRPVSLSERCESSLSNSSLSNVASCADDQVTKTLKVIKKRCEFFQGEMERIYKNILKLNDEKKESIASKVLDLANPMAGVIIGVGGVLVILMSVPTLGIGTASVGAAVALATLTVKSNDYLKNRKTERERNANKLNELCGVDPASMILTILKEVSIELSRIFEEQLFKLQNNKDVTEMASCAVYLMFKLKDGDKFDRNTLLRNVLCREAKANQKVKMRNKNILQARGLFQKTGLRKEVAESGSSSPVVQFEYFSKGDDYCDPQKYGYRSEVLEMICKTANESEAGHYITNSCCPIDADGVGGEVTYFVECDIDKEYKVPCSEVYYYQPFHCLVRCPSILKNLASKANNCNRPSLKNVVSKMYHQRIRPVRPVYRPHSPRIVHSLNNTDLSDSDFSRVNFSSSSLEDCDLTGCTMLFGELKKASFRRSEFKETYLSNCNLTDANAQQCTWTTTKVLYSCVDNADLRGGSNIVGGNSWEGTSLEKAKVSDKPSSSRVTKKPELTVPPGINAAERRGNGKPSISDCVANNNNLQKKTYL